MGAWRGAAASSEQGSPPQPPPRLNQYRGFIQPGPDAIVRMSPFNDQMSEGDGVAEGSRIASAEPPCRGH